MFISIKRCTFNLIDSFSGVGFFVADKIRKHLRKRLRRDVMTVEKRYWKSNHEIEGAIKVIKLLNFTMSLVFVQLNSTKEKMYVVKIYYMIKGYNQIHFYFMFSKYRFIKDLVVYKFHYYNKISEKKG